MYVAMFGEAELKRCDMQRFWQRFCMPYSNRRMLYTNKLVSVKKKYDELLKFMKKNPYAEDFKTFSNTIYNKRLTLECLQKIEENITTIFSKIKRRKKMQIHAESKSSTFKINCEQSSSAYKGYINNDEIIYYEINNNKIKDQDNISNLKINGQYLLNSTTESHGAMISEVHKMKTSVGDCFKTQSHCSNKKDDILKNRSCMINFEVDKKIELLQNNQCNPAANNFSLMEVEKDFRGNQGDYLNKSKTPGNNKSYCPENTNVQNMAAMCPNHLESKKEFYSNNPFVSLREMNQSSLYDKVKMDKMMLDFQIARMKHGTVLDLNNDNIQKSKPKTVKKPKSSLLNQTYNTFISTIPLDDKTYYSLKKAISLIKMNNVLQNHNYSRGCRHLNETSSNDYSFSTTSQVKFPINYRQVLSYRNKEHYKPLVIHASSNLNSPKFIGNSNNWFDSPFYNNSTQYFNPTLFNNININKSHNYRSYCPKNNLLHNVPIEKSNGNNILHKKLVSNKNYSFTHFDSLKSGDLILNNRVNKTNKNNNHIIGNIINTPRKQSDSDGCQYLSNYKRGLVPNKKRKMSEAFDINVKSNKSQGHVEQEAEDNMNLSSGKMLDEIIHSNKVTKEKNNPCKKNVNTLILMNKGKNNQSKSKLILKSKLINHGNDVSVGSTDLEQIEMENSCNLYKCASTLNDRNKIIPSKSTKNYHVGKQEEISIHYRGLKENSSPLIAEINKHKEGCGSKNSHSNINCKSIKTTEQNHITENKCKRKIMMNRLDLCHNDINCKIHEKRLKPFKSACEPIESCAVEVNRPSPKQQTLEHSVSHTHKITGKKTKQQKVEHRDCDTHKIIDEKVETKSSKIYNSFLATNGKTNSSRFTDSTITNSIFNGKKNELVSNLEIKRRCELANALTLNQHDCVKEGFIDSNNMLPGSIYITTFLEKIESLVTSIKSNQNKFKNMHNILCLFESLQFPTIAKSHSLNTQNNHFNNSISKDILPVSILEYSNVLDDCLLNNCANNVQWENQNDNSLVLNSNKQKQISKYEKRKTPDLLVTNEYCLDKSMLTGLNNIIISKTKQYLNTDVVSIEESSATKSLSKGGIAETNKKRLQKKSCELNKLYEDLRKLPNYTDIMKCTGLRSCRIKNNLKRTSEEKKCKTKIRKSKITKTHGSLPIVPTHLLNEDKSALTNPCTIKEDKDQLFKFNNGETKNELPLQKNKRKKLNISFKNTSNSLSSFTENEDFLNPSYPKETVSSAISPLSINIPSGVLNDNASYNLNYRNSNVLNNDGCIITIDDVLSIPNESTCEDYKNIVIDFLSSIKEELEEP